MTAAATTAAVAAEATEAVGEWAVVATGADRSRCSQSPASNMTIRTPRHRHRSRCQKRNHTRCYTLDQAPAAVVRARAAEAAGGMGEGGAEVTATVEEAAREAVVKVTVYAAGVERKAEVATAKAAVEEAGAAQAARVAVWMARMAEVAAVVTTESGRVEAASGRVVAPQAARVTVAGVKARVAEAEEARAQAARAAAARRLWRRLAARRWSGSAMGGWSARRGAASPTRPGRRGTV